MYRLDAIVQKLGRSEHAVVAGEEGPRAAVAAVFREAGVSDAELLFIRRAEHPRDPWSGHIAFPGGRRDPSDASLLQTAMRETLEEVGLDLSSAELLARLPDVPAFTRTKRGSLVVTPFVFAVRHDITLAPNHEVAQTLWVPFSALARGEGKGTYRFAWDGKDYDLPCIRFQPGDHLLWGLTYKMVEELVDLFGRA